MNGKGSQQHYYSTKEVKIFNTNCLEYLKTVSDNSIKFVLTSPPYDDLRNYDGYSFDFESIAKELTRTLAEGGVIIWNVSDATVNGSETGTSMKQALFFMSCGLRLHDTMIYEKRNPMPASRSSKRYHQAWEYIFCFSKGTPETFNPFMVPAKYGHVTANMKHRGKDGNIEYTKTKRNSHTKVRNIFTYSVGGGHSTSDKEAHGHPALMPEKLAEDQILTWTNPGDTVFDPFSGAGTTGKMSIKNNRMYVGTEVSKEYCDLSIIRIECILKNIQEKQESAA
jgi:site-specific DNA-methyltransferase (adenine-specific)